MHGWACSGGLGRRGSSRGSLSSDEPSRSGRQLSTLLASHCDVHLVQYVIVAGM
jgi:hypothetical protein